MPHSEAALTLFKTSAEEIGQAMERIALSRLPAGSVAEKVEFNMAVVEALVIAASPGIARNYGLPIEALQSITEAMLQAGEAEAERLKQEMN